MTRWTMVGSEATVTEAPRARFFFTPEPPSGVLCRAKHAELRAVQLARLYELAVLVDAGGHAAQVRQSREVAVAAEHLRHALRRPRLDAPVAGRQRVP
jgi:hypothetical protein